MNFKHNVEYYVFYDKKSVFFIFIFISLDCAKEGIVFVTSFGKVSFIFFTQWNVIQRSSSWYVALSLTHTHTYTHSLSLFHTHTLSFSLYSLFMCLLFPHFFSLSLFYFSLCLFSLSHFSFFYISYSLRIPFLFLPFSHYFTLSVSLSLS